ncbi:shikimate dehydrogenase, partial [Ciceribacter sp. sgz301302]
AIMPGGIRTELGRHMTQADEDALVASINTSYAKAGLPPFAFKTIPQGAATSVWAAVVADAELIGGCYCEDCHVAEIAEGEAMRDGVRAYALDEERAKQLWAKSEEWVGERF